MRSWTRLSQPTCVSLRLLLKNRSSPVFTKRGAFLGVDIIISVYLTECQRKVLSKLFSVQCSASFPRRFEPAVAAVSDLILKSYFEYKSFLDYHMLTEIQWS